MDSRALEANRALLDEALALRRRKAALLGYPSWAHFRIEPKMAVTPERVRLSTQGSCRPSGCSPARNTPR